nr:small integral membrane protein 31-like [Nothobranchius furzeri]
MDALCWAVVSMEVPFTGFELTFIVLAFVIFTLFSLASVCLQPQDLPSEGDLCEAKKSQPSKRKNRVIIKHARERL